MTVRDNFKIGDGVFVVGHQGRFRICDLLFYGYIVDHLEPENNYTMYYIVQKECGKECVVPVYNLFLNRNEALRECEIRNRIKDMKNLSKCFRERPNKKVIERVLEWALERIKRNDN